MAKGEKMKTRVIFFYCLAILFFTFSVIPLSAAEVTIVTDQDYFPLVLKSFGNAKKSIQVMMFEASYYQKYPNTPSNVLIRELTAAQKRGVKVEVILETRKGDQERTTKRNRNTGKILSNSGVEVTYDHLEVTTHAKLIIIDGKKCILGSSNWTYHSLSYNHEANVLIKSEKIAKEFQDYFQRVKKGSCKP